MSSLMKCSNLEQIEQVLVNLFIDITIINELSIGKFEYKRIESLISIKLKNNKVQVNTISLLWKKYPYCCMTVTVFIAIYHYDGNYWGHFKELTNCLDEQRWKEWFLYYIKMKGLPLFDELGTQKYVSTILGHAGVPNESLIGFIKGFIQPAVQFDLDAEEAITDLNSIDHRQISASYKLHKGVKDYLFTGGKVAVDFVDRCLLVVKENERPYVEKYKGYLPRRILSGMEKTLTAELAEKMIKSEKLLPPTMKMDPFLYGVYISFPIQKVTLSMVKNTCIWKIVKQDNSVEYIECDIVFLGNSRQYELIPKRKRLKVSPNQEYSIRLEIDGQLIRNWKIETKGALLFDASTRKSLNKNLLHSGTYWVVIDKQFSLSKESELFHDLSTEPLFDQWHLYLLYEITPNQNHKILFHRLDDKVEINVFTKKDDPKFLEQDAKLWGGEIPTFFGAPTLCIPVSTYPNFRRELEKWMLKINHNQNATRTEMPLNNYGDRLKLVGENFHINLSEIDIDFSEGRHDLRIVGPLGKDIRLSFIILPSTLILKEMNNPENPSVIYGYKDNEYELSIDNSFSVTCLWPSDVALIQHIQDYSQNNYRLTVPAAVSKIKMQIKNNRTSETFEVDLNTKLITWEVYQNQKLTEKKNQFLSISQQKFEENDYRVLLNTSQFKSILNGIFLTITIYLRNDIGKILQKLIRKVRVGAQVPIILDQFKDTILLQESSYFSLWMEINDFLADSIPIIRIQKNWAIQNVKVEILKNKIKINWDENMCISNRVLRIWDEFHPWKSYEEFAIDQQCFEIDIPWENKSSGTYLFEWATNRGNDDFFSFLEKIKYPVIPSSNTYRWTLEDSLVQESNSLAVVLFSDENIRTKVDFQSKDLDDILKGINEYGEDFKGHLRENHFIWYEACQLHKNELINALHLIKMDENKASIIKDLFGIQEWTLEEIVGLPEMLKNNLNLESIAEVSKFGNFGQTVGMFSTMLTKSVEDCHIISQSIPFVESVIKGFSVQHELIQFLIKRKSNQEYSEKLKAFIKIYRTDLLDLYDWVLEKEFLSEETEGLMKSRWETLDEPFDLNFPFYVAITALGSRLLAGNSEIIPFSYKRLLRNAVNQIKSLHPIWFIFDCTFIELHLQNTQKGEFYNEYSSNKGN